ncbi:hypothetical protein MANI_025094 [Metarhizium anisopliae]
MCAADTNGSFPRPSSQQRLPYQSVQDHLSDFGVEYIELTSPVRLGVVKNRLREHLQAQAQVQDPDSYANAYPASLFAMSTRQHPPLDVPCNLEDAKAAVATGVDGVDLVIGTARKRGPLTQLPWIESVLLIQLDVLPLDKCLNWCVRFVELSIAILKPISTTTPGVPSPMHMQRCWNAIKSRSEQLGLSMSDDQYKILTAKIKQMADIRPLAIDDTDSIIRAYHHELENPA